MTAKKNQIAILLQKQFQEKLLGQGTMMKDTAKKVEKIEDIESLLRRLKDDIVKNEKSILSSKEDFQNNVKVLFL